MTKLTPHQSAQAAANRSHIEQLNGAEILIRALELENIKHIWGYPGGAVLNIYDALFKQNSIQHFLVRHEQAAVHAADAYARTTGEVGVAFVTSGPGLTNAITGIATAYMDSVPMVIISGQVPSPVIGQDAFQECDAVGVTRPIVKHNFLVQDIDSLADIIKKAFHIARTGRPGPVLIDIPKDISAQFIGFNQKKYLKAVKMRGYNPNYNGHPGQIKRAADTLLQAKKPCIYYGGGIISSAASAELVELANILQAPVVSTLMGLGGFPASHPLYLGMVGMHGTAEANHCMQESDVLLALGARFDDRVVGNVAHFCSNQTRKIIHIDIDPSSISKRVRAHIPIVGEVKLVLKKLIALLQDLVTKQQASHLAAWWQQISQWQQLDCLNYQRDSQQVIKPQLVVELLSELTKNDDVYIASDVGQHQMWAAQYFKFEQPRRWLNSGGLGTMGVGLPYAIGAKTAYPDSDVYCISGDGSIQMCIQELSTCQQYDTPVKIIILNNGNLGMVKQWQQLIYDERYSQIKMENQPDFVLLAQAYGHIGIQVNSPQELLPALQQARAIKDRTVLLNIMVDPTENVMPMVQAGQGLTQLVFRDKA